MANDCIPFYEPGSTITADATAAVTGKRFLKISADRTAGPGLNTSGAGGNLQVAHATAAGRICGVAGWDAAIGAKVAVIRGNSRVVPVLAGAAIAAFEQVEVGANGTAVPLAAGVAVGYAVTAAANATDAQISLY